MATDTARILVIGASVNGSICAASLQIAGFNVTLLALEGIKLGSVTTQKVLNPLL